MARSYKELQAKMNPVHVAENREAVKEYLRTGFMRVDFETWKAAAPEHRFFKWGNGDEQDRYYLCY